MALTEIFVLIRKEMQLEWRNKYAIHGLVLYLAATIFICYLSFKAKQQSIHPIMWNTLFWIILLFSAVNAVGKSFTQESANRNIFYYTFAKPESVIFSKIIYNTLVMLGVSFIGIFFYSWVMGNPVGNMPLYLASLVLGAIGFAYPIVSSRNCRSGREFGYLDGCNEFSFNHSIAVIIIKII